MKSLEKNIFHFSIIFMLGLSVSSNVNHVFPLSCGKISEMVLSNVGSRDCRPSVKHVLVLCDIYETEIEMSLLQLLCFL